MRTTILQRTSAALALALTLFASTVARAGDASPDAIEKSSALYKQARALQVRGKWTEAEAAYQAAWDLRRTFDIAGNLGDCELHVGQPREAAEHLAFALKNVPAGVTAEQTEAMRGLLTQAKEQVGTLRITVNVGGAQLVVDSRPIEDTGGEVFVAPGVRTIEARLAGYAAVQKTVSVGAGASEKVDLVLAAQKRSVVPAVVMGGLGGVALVSGIGVMAAAVSKRSTAIMTNQAITQAHHSCVVGASNFDSRCSNVGSGSSSADTLERVGIGMFIIAGAQAIGATTYLLWPASKPSASGARGLVAVPVVSAVGGGVVLSGAF